MHPLGPLFVALLGGDGSCPVRMVAVMAAMASHSSACVCASGGDLGGEVDRHRTGPRCALLHAVGDAPSEPSGLGGTLHRIPQGAPSMRSSLRPGWAWCQSSTATVRHRVVPTETPTIHDHKTHFGGEHQRVVRIVKSPPVMRS